VQVFAMRSMASGAAFHRAYLHATQQAFLEAHEHAFAYFGGVFRLLRSDYVPGNKIAVMCPTPLCGRERRLDGFRGRTADVGPHNVLQGVDPIEHGLVVLPDGAIAGCR